MHEVINFSCSQASGHLITQLYNVQESHLPYSRQKTLTHTNDVFLVPRRVKGRTNYYPRSINVDFQGGFGYLGKHAFSEAPVAVESYTDVEIKTQQRQVKNEFQANLDAGKPVDASLLSTENTAFWTDYNKLIYRPESLVSLNNFNHPDGTHKNFPRLRFDAFNTGEAEFKLSEDEIDDFFRKNLEQSDQIQGVTFFSECDNGWAGYTSEMMVFLRDEYFGNGVSSKYNLWTYGLMTPGVTLSKTETVLTRIKALTEFAANSTVFIPLAAPKSHGSLLTESYESSKLWHQGAVQSMFVNSLWGLNCQVQNPVSMATIENNLLRGNSNRNIVNNVNLKQVKPESKGSSSDFGIISDVNIMDMYLGHSHTTQPTPKPKPKPEYSVLNLGLTSNPDSNEHVYSKGIVRPNAPESSVTDSNTDTYINPYMAEVTETASFPNILETPNFHAEFAQTTGLKPLLKDYRKIVDRVRHPQHMEILGDRAEVVENLSSLIEEYTVGYSDESDFDD